jgi:hypothetical protein
LSIREAYYDTDHMSFPFFFFLFEEVLIEETVTAKVPKSKGEGRQDRRKPAVPRTNISHSGQNPPPGGYCV